MADTVGAARSRCIQSAYAAALHSRRILQCLAKSYTHGNPQLLMLCAAAHAAALLRFFCFPSCRLMTRECDDYVAAAAHESAAAASRH
jgi:hypothetical protein